MITDEVLRNKHEGKYQTVLEMLDSTGILLPLHVIIHLIDKHLFLASLEQL